jgi:hypothetical protein
MSFPVSETSFTTPGASEIFETYREIVVEFIGLGVAEGAKGDGGGASLSFSLYISWFMTIPTDVVPL